jgi:hypothetical protein
MGEFLDDERVGRGNSSSKVLACIVKCKKKPFVEKEIVEKEIQA